MGGGALPGRMWAGNGCPRSALASRPGSSRRASSCTARPTIEVRWSSDFTLLALTGALLAAWVALLAIPGDSIPRRRVAEGVAAAILFLSLIQITAPMQYGALALGRPFVDVWLDSADRWLGIDVAQLTAWTAQFPWLVAVLNLDLQQPRAADDRAARRAPARRRSDALSGSICGTCTCR